MSIVVPDRPEPALVDSGSGLACAGLAHRVLLPGADRSVPCDASDPDEGDAAAGGEAAPASPPAVVMLHGRGGSEDDTWIFAKTFPKDWIAVAPRGIEEHRGGGRAWVPRERGEWPPLSRFERAAEAVSGLVAALPELYDADPERVFLLGFSQGAATAYASLFANPGLAVGVVGLVGFLPGLARAAVAEQPLDGLPVLMLVGRHDRFIPRSISQDCARGLRAAGASVDYREYDVGHKVSMQGFKDLRRWWRVRAAGWA